jgi:hypothetical protein
LAVVRREVQLGLAGALAVLSLIATASPAAASVTIGRLAPAPSLSCVGSSLDLIEPTGTPYVVPPVPPASALTISSWSHNGAPAAGLFPATGPLTLKVYRKVADPATYQVTGHDTEPLIPATLNTFPANLPVQPGDVIGTTTTAPATSGCNFADPGQPGYLANASNLADGESAAFGGPPATGRSLDVSAVVSPSNVFTITKGKAKKKKGTMALTADVPNPGDLALSGTGVKATAATVAAPGQVKLVVRASGTKRKKLNQTGAVKLTATVTYTPTGGDPSTQSLKLKLKKL